jgi:hypothetical protein
VPNLRHPTAAPGHRRTCPSRRHLDHGAASTLTALTLATSTHAASTSTASTCAASTPVASAATRSRSHLNTHHLNTRRHHKVPPTRVAPACYRPNAHCLHPRPPAASTRSSNVSHLHSAHMRRATTSTTKCPNTLPPQPPPHYLPPPRLAASTPERLPTLRALKLPDKFFICLFSPFFPHLTLNWSRRPSLPSRARSCHDATPTNAKTMAMQR